MLGLDLIIPPVAAKVLTLVGFPPTPCFFDLFLLTADFLCDLVMLAAFAAGTHFGYFLLVFFALDLPHFLNPPPFFGDPISTQSSLNHLVRLITL